MFFFDHQGLTYYNVQLSYEYLCEQYIRLETLNQTLKLRRLNFQLINFPDNVMNIVQLTRHVFKRI